jgi:16S rRNA (guanine(966)-N(2))-methyltransferase RsmD
MFNVLAGLAGIDAAVLDLFAGTGALGIEALSRGASSAVFVDCSRVCCEVIRKNLEHTKLLKKAEILPERWDAATKALGKAGRQFGLIFIDPPYGKGLVAETLKALPAYGLMAPRCALAVEQAASDSVIEAEGFEIIKLKRYTASCLIVYACTPSQP